MGNKIVANSSILSEKSGKQNLENIILNPSTQFIDLELLFLMGDANPIQVIDFIVNNQEPLNRIISNLLILMKVRKYSIEAYQKIITDKEQLQRLVNLDSLVELSANSVDFEILAKDIPALVLSKISSVKELLLISDIGTMNSILDEDMDKMSALIKSTKDFQVLQANAFPFVRFFLKHPEKFKHFITTEKDLQLLHLHEEINFNSNINELCYFANI